MFFEVFAYDFMIRAFIAGALISVIAPLIGNFLVLKRLSQMGDTISHVALAGIALGLLLGLNPTVSSLIVVLLSSFFIEKLRKSYFQYSEISIAVTMSFGMAVAIFLIGLNRGGNLNIINYLFGSIVSITKEDVYIIFLLTIFELMSVYLLYKELVFITFDEEAAESSGIPVKFINIFFMILVSLTVAVSMRIVGALLVSSLLVIPSAASLKLSKSFTQTILYGMLFSFISVFVGIILSFYLDLSPGALIVLILLLILAVVNFISSRK